MADWELPERGVVFWPVGNGDAVTVALDDDTVIQIDVHHPEVAGDDDDDRVPVVDRLVEHLPKPAGADKPVLSVLAITHHDSDHCRGFGRLIEEVSVCELWITLRSFVEHKNEDGGLPDGPGKDVYEEACRRRKAEVDAHAKGGRAEPGSRLRVIGNSSVLDDADWKDFPEDLLTSAGECIADINGEDHSDKVEIFIHTPFHDDTQDGSRNSSSLGMQLTLKAGECERRFLLLGDLEYEQLDAFCDKSVARGNEDRLDWDVLLAPHHCSRHAILKEEDGEYVETEAVEHLENHAAEGAVVVASCRGFDVAKDGDSLPPHEEARTVYERIVGKDNFLSTSDYANGSDSEPLTISVTEDECGEVRESKAARIDRLKSISSIGGAAAVRPGDRTGGTGDDEFAV